MGPTETRTRDEWLAEVRRRGERIRRRRRLTVTLVGVLALVLPASALAGFLSARPGHDQQLSVAGPSPAGDVAEGVLGPAPTSTVPDEPATTTTIAPQLKVEAVHGRTGPDDPVIRPTTTIASANTAGAVESPLPSTAVPPASVTPPAPCAAGDVKVTITMEKNSYRPGEVVRASTSMERRSATACWMPGFEDFQILNSAGKDVLLAGATIETGNSASQGADGGVPFVKSSLAWEALDCTAQRLSPIVPAPGDRTGCVPFPPGTYTVVPHWSETSLTAPATFALTA